MKVLEIFIWYFKNIKGEKKIESWIYFCLIKKLSVKMSCLHLKRWDVLSSQPYLEGKRHPIYNIDKCSAESIYFLLASILLSIKFKSGFHGFQIWHLIGLMKYFPVERTGVKEHGVMWFFVLWNLETGISISIFVSIMQLHFGQIMKSD